jgi:radical SAM protein with 4Fe4S-binding SPASM domain
MVDFSRALGAESVVFNRYLGIPQPGLEIDTMQLQKAVNQIERLRRESHEVRFGNCIPQCFTASGSSGCWAGTAYCTIDPWGRMRPCNHSPMIIGSLFEQSIEQLWRSEAMQSWRDLLAPGCSRCGQIEVCHGGCRAMAEILPTGKDPLISEPCMGSDITHLRLYSAARPLLVCDIESESFGYSLIQGQSILPVSGAAGHILEQLDGDHTLQEIRDSQGPQALELVGALVHRGFAKLA